MTHVTTILVAVILGVSLAWGLAHFRPQVQLAIGIRPTIETMTPEPRPRWWQWRKRLRSET